MYVSTFYLQTLSHPGLGRQIQGSQFLLSFFLFPHTVLMHSVLAFALAFFFPPPAYTAVVVINDNAKTPKNIRFILVIIIC